MIYLCSDLSSQTKLSTEKSQRRRRRRALEPSKVMFIPALSCRSCRRLHQVPYGTLLARASLAVSTPWIWRVQSGFAKTCASFPLPSRSLLRKLLRQGCLPCNEGVRNSVEGDTVYSKSSPARAMLLLITSPNEGMRHPNVGTTIYIPSMVLRIYLATSSPVVQSIFRMSHAGCP